MTSSGWILLILAALLSTGIAYLLAFSPQKNPRFREITNRLNLPSKQAAFIIFIGLSTVPSILVIQDRWLGQVSNTINIDSNWWDSLVSLPLIYPGYFVFIFGLIIFLWLMVFAWEQSPPLSLSTNRSQTTSLMPKNIEVDEILKKRSSIFILAALGMATISAGIAVQTKRIPGWELILTIGIYTYGSILMDHRREITKYFLNHIVLVLDACLLASTFCGVIYVLSGEARHVLIFYFIFLLTSLHLYISKRSLPLIFWISIASLFALTWKINGWEYTVIGDEYAFYNANLHLDGSTFWTLVNSTFRGGLVYGAHPYLSSYIQAVFMEIFGRQNFGWRFSNPFLVYASLFLFYYFFEYFTSKRTALIIVILLGFSHYLMSFAKIGYNNLQAFFALSLVLAILTYSLKSTKPTAFAFLGLAMGFCFYVYPAALYVMPLPFFGLLIFLPPTNQDSIKRWGWMILSCLLVIYPLFFQPKYWQEKIPGTFLFTQMDSSAAKILKNILSNTVYSLFSYLYIPEESHFVSTGYLDPLSSIFVIFGSAVVIRMIIQRRKDAIFLFLCFASFLILVGATHGRDFPSATRMFLLLPWFALFAAYGMEWTFEKLKLLFKMEPKTLLTILLGGIILLNLYNTYVVDIYRSAQYHNAQSLFIRTVNLINDAKNISPKSYYFIAEGEWNIEAINLLQRAYRITDSPSQIMNLPVEKSLIPANSEAIIRSQDTIVIIWAYLDRNTIKAVDTQLNQWGKSMCEIKNEQGVTGFQLWHSGDLSWLCE
jgi:4-amino-4-deoxy-L-arabinose transferase-like glycosyltransferase